MTRPQIWIAAAAVLAGVAALAFAYSHHLQNCAVCAQVGSWTPDTIRHFIRGFGPLAIVVYVLLYTANTFSPFFPPILIMSLTAGLVFGPFLGTLALTLGTWSGTTAAFYAARTIGRPWVEKRLAASEAGADLYRKFSRHGFAILLPMRLIGFPPYGIIDFICGLSKMRYAEFAAATMLGAAPWIVVQVLLADRFARFGFRDPLMWVLLAVFVAMIVITGMIIQRKKERGDGNEGKVSGV